MAQIPLTQDEIKEMINDPYMRVLICKDSFFHFIAYYMQDDFELDPADFHKEMIDALDSVNDMDKYLSILGFRGSAKSTILEAFALWSLINGKHNFIIYIRSTIDDAKMSLANIRSRIEDSDDIRKDFNIVLDVKREHGFREKWSESQITVGDCTMMARSRLQKIRGKKFKKARIDLIIGDDLEDVKDADTQEKRVANRKWFFSEVLPATKQGVLGDNVKVILLGNLVHRDCLIKHFSRSDTVRSLEFWLYDKDGKISWPGLYPDEKAIQAEKDKVMIAGEGLGPVIWAREYLGKEVDEEDMLLKLDEIQRYPDEWLQRKAENAGVGVDFAISKKQTADYTAMVKGSDVKNDDGELRLLVMKNNVNLRLGFKETITKAVEINNIMPQGTIFYPEKQSYQESAIEIMEDNGIKCHRMINTADKRSRIASACFYVKNGRVLFPRTGAEDVINNILGFGIEDHDDLADAWANLVLGMVKKNSAIVFG